LSHKTPVAFTGSRYWRGHWDFVYFLQEIVRAQLGVDLLDASGRSFVHVFLTDSLREPLLHRRIFGQVKLPMLYTLYRKAQLNTNVPESDRSFRPHGHRTNVKEEGLHAMDKGLLSPSLENGLAAQLNHSTVSRHKGAYLSNSYLLTFAFGALFSPNPNVRKLGVVRPLATLTSELGYVPRVLYLPDKKNLEVVRRIVAVKLAIGMINAERTKMGGRPWSETEGVIMLTTPAARVVSMKLRQLKQRFGKKHLPELEFLASRDRLAYVDKVWIASVSGGMTRGEIVQWCKSRVLPFW